MSGIQLPVTYSYSAFYWIYIISFFSVLVVVAVMTPDPLWTPIFIIFIPVGLALYTYWGLTSQLEVTSEGIINMANFRNFEMGWGQVERVEIMRDYSLGYPVWDPILWYTQLLIYESGNNKSRTIGLTWYSKDDLREFMSILRAKAPLASVNPKVFEFLE